MAVSRGIERRVASRRSKFGQFQRNGQIRPSDNPIGSRAWVTEPFVGRRSALSISKAISPGSDPGESGHFIAIGARICSGDREVIRQTAAFFRPGLLPAPG